MPTATVLKSTVTRRLAAEPVDQAERQLQAEHHQAAEADTAAGTSTSTEPAQTQDLEPAPESEGSVESPEAEAESTPSQRMPRKQRKWEEQREAHAVQSAFLAGNLGKLVTVFTINGLRLIGKLRQFDQYCLLLEGRDGIHSLVFKHAITTVAPASAVPGKQRQSEPGGAYP